MFGLTQHEADMVKSWAERHPEILRVYLYGSRAKGNHRPDSDIDLALEMIVDPFGETVDATFIHWHSAYEKNPDFPLPYPAHFYLYVPNSNADQIVGPAVESHGLIVFDRSSH